MRKDSYSKKDILDTLIILKEGKSMDNRVLRNFINMLFYLEDPYDIDIVLEIIKDKKMHMLEVDALMNFLRQKLKNK